MSPHRESPSQSLSRSTVRGRRLAGRSGGPLVAAGLVAALALATAPALAVDLRVATENDFLTGDNQDDLYTFSVALAAERGPYTFTLRENAFTDRQAGRRFDETHLTAGRALPDLGAWSLYAEGGAVHVGRGLFGQAAQNALHRVLGQEEVELRYLGSRLHPRLRLEAERLFLPADDLDVGPRLEADSIPGFRSHAVLGAQARWRSGAGITLHLFAGGRWSRESLALLDRHTTSWAPLARVGVVVAERIFVSWTYNEYGDEREHLSVGLRIAGGDWRQDAGAPRGQ